MHRVKEKGGIRGTVTVRAHPAGTIDKWRELMAAGKKEEARQLLQQGRIAARRHNLVVSSLNCGYDSLVQFLISGYTGSFSLNNSTTLTGTTDGSTAIITGLSGTSGIALGMNISGAGIPFYSTVIAINSGTSITISQNTTSAGTGPLYFVQQNQLGISWGEIGTGQTTPTNLDTALTAPTNRMPVSYAADNAFNEAQIQFFFPDSTLANGTYYEFGAFIGGSATIGSGNMFNHALFTNPYSKSSGTDSTVECDLGFATQNSGEFDEAVFS
jgi:hypothetical protein